jgi:hypothetical protein
MNIKNDKQLKGLFSGSSEEIFSTLVEKGGRGLSPADILSKHYGIDLSTLDAETAKSLQGAVANVTRHGTTGSVDNLRNEVFKVLRAKAGAGGGASEDEVAAQKAMAELADARKEELKAMNELTSEVRNLLGDVKSHRDMWRVPWLGRGNDSDDKKEKVP